VRRRGKCVVEGPKKKKPGAQTNDRALRRGDLFLAGKKKPVVNEEGGGGGKHYLFRDPLWEGGRER